MRCQKKYLVKPDAGRYLKSTSIALNQQQRITKPKTWKSTTGERCSFASLTGCPMSYTEDSRERMTHLLGQSYQVFTALLSHVTGREKLDDKAAASVKHMCEFYDVDEENLITELKVFHASYLLHSNNVKAALKCLGENDVESVFPSFRDISIDQNKVIDIYKQMAKRRILLYFHLAQRLIIVCFF